MYESEFISYQASADGLESLYGHKMLEMFKMLHNLEKARKVPENIEKGKKKSRKYRKG